MNAQENKQVVLRGYQLFQNKDIQGLLELYADDIEWIGYESEYIPFAGAYRGKNQVAEFFSTLDQAQEAIRFEPQNVIAENDKVVVTGQAEWLVKSTGQKYDSFWVHVLTLQDGKVTQFQHYDDTAAAEAAFRSPQTSSPGKEAPMRH
jgi:ketosteroid isomerase-like protein